MSGVNDEDYYLPLTDQRVFGAGVKRKRIAFIPAGQNDTALPHGELARKPHLADRYLSIVLPKQAPDTEPSNQTPDSITEPVLCVICEQPITSSDGVSTSIHEASISHQLCLQHSHPPSHLPRDHVGLRYLQGYGWNPDARTGLGARQEGIRIPIKAKNKRDTAGLKEVDDEDDVRVQREKGKEKLREKDVVVKTLDAGKIRKQDIAARKKAEKLRASFYGPDLSHYLGPDG